MLTNTATPNQEFGDFRTVSIIITLTNFIDYPCIDLYELIFEECIPFPRSSDPYLAGGSWVRNSLSLLSLICQGIHRLKSSGGFLPLAMQASK